MNRESRGNADGDNRHVNRAPTTGRDTSEAEKYDGESGRTAGPRWSISRDDAFHLLQNSRRRAIIQHLLAHPEEESFRIRDLAETVAAREHDTSVDRLTSTERQRVYIALYQSHYPKLDDYGVINYNKQRGIVTSTPLLGALDPLLEAGYPAEPDHLTIRAETERDTGPGGPTTVPWRLERPFLTFLRQ